MSVKYAAVIEHTDARGFGVWFPDFPGCVALGDDPLTAAQAAQSVLARHVERMADDGEPIPAPTPSEAVELPHDVLSYVFLVEVDAPDAKVAYVRLNVTLPEGLVRRIDAVSGGNRSGWLALAAGEQLKRYGTIPNFAASVYSTRDNKR
ncbi:MAG TPA: type II toxin-antitoxin system HicB family antitoxin [Caulobacteraceae bacterium]|nr:type II toxin-antitoxin system HicB family antitoxin [Caulobacteraceae bacterium]